jgi:predicted RNA-binding protein (virulence factor B family)
VECLCFEETDIGYRVIVNQKYQGMVFKNEVFNHIEVGDQFLGYVRMIREDGHIDLSIMPVGRTKISGIASMVLETLDKEGGFLPLTDKSNPADIQATFGISKKAFKEAIGTLYKNREITLESGGIRRNPKA